MLPGGENLGNVGVLQNQINKCCVITSVQVLLDLTQP